MKKWILGKYHRLSAEEYGVEESNSIVNQKKIIDNYLSDKKDIKIYKSYVDDGYTGTDFNRPGFKQMMKDIESGKINGVIIKDLSRLGRNYIQVDDFIEETIPYYNLQFISVNDNVDSFKDPNFMSSLEIPFKNLMNEGYSRDTSKKMRSSLIASKKSGNFIGKVAPYGYIKDPEDCHKFIVDNDAAKIIKKIFNLALKGVSKQDIVTELNNKNILTPSMYLKKQLNYKYVMASDEWKTDTIDYILKNRNYIGSSVQGKRTRISHKVHNIVRVPEEDWMIYKNHHDAIIKEKVFNQVQDILYNRNVKVNNIGKLSKYSGFLKCSECGSNLYRMSKTKNGRKMFFYYCGTYMRTKKCNKHYILEKELDELVIESLNNFLNLLCNVKYIIDSTVCFSGIEYNEELKKIKIVELEKELKKYKDLIDSLLHDYKMNIISQQDYEDFKENYLYEINKLNIEKEELVNDKSELLNLDWLNNFRNLENLNKIDRNIVNEFIKNIYVDDNKNIEIVFRYKEQYDEIIKYLKFKQKCDII